VFLFLLSLLDLRFATLKHLSDVSCIQSAHTRDNKQKKNHNFCPITGANKSNKILHSTQKNGMSPAWIIHILNSKMAPSLERSNPCVYRSPKKEQWARTKHLSPTTRVACHNGIDVGSGSYFYIRHIAHSSKMVKHNPLTSHFISAL